MLHWLEPTHLDIPLNLHHLQVCNLLYIEPTLLPPSLSVSPGAGARECQQAASL